MFRGSFQCKLDAKGRLKLPSPCRKSFESGQKASLVITNSQYQQKRCLDVYMLPEWEELELRISRLSSFDPAVQMYQRFYLSCGQKVEMDAQGRFVIPSSLRKFAELEESVVLVGMQNKFEIWSEKSWNELHQNMANVFEQSLKVIGELTEKKKEIGLA